MTKVLHRIRHLSKQPANRTKYAVFVLFGLVLALFSLLISEPLKTILIEFSVTFGAVTVIQILWEFLGGDPSEEKLENYHSELEKGITVIGSDIQSRFEGIQSQLGVVNDSIQSRFEGIQSQLGVVNDLIQYDLGIEHIWPSRRAFKDESTMGIKWWRERIYASKEIAILSITLWTDWMQDHEFRKGLRNSVEKGAKVKLIVYEPGSDIQKWRAWAEEDPGDEMVSEIDRTVHAIKNMRDRLQGDLKDNLEIRYTYEAHHFVQLFRCDDEMLIGFYLHGLDGLSSPTIYVRGKDKRFYKAYSDQFERLWRHGKPVGDIRP